MKVRRLLSDPAQEFGDIGIRAQLVRLAELPLQLGIGEGGVQRAVADRMYRHRSAPAAAFGHGMMIFHPPPQWPPAQPADQAFFFDAFRSSGDNVFGLWRHRSVIWQRQHSGVRALQT